MQNLAIEVQVALVVGVTTVLSAIIAHSRGKANGRTPSGIEDRISKVEEEFKTVEENEIILTLRELIAESKKTRDAAEKAALTSQWSYNELMLRSGRHLRGDPPRD
ncbi:hypothetical protein P7F88_25585 [Vibrio hannami]|uniref:hypothetical protein n=1 Tax=Vibrio hannami TaxID=2717094 RepID=UPI00240EEE8E|nr:hypothetical protein [Vibrio hannami]MDG3089239.1 hypothetical protein [Vibrio hannami]